MSAIILASKIGPPLFAMNLATSLIKFPLTKFDITDMHEAISPQNLMIFKANLQPQLKNFLILESTNNMTVLAIDNAVPVRPIASVIAIPPLTSFQSSYVISTPIDLSIGLTLLLKLFSILLSSQMLSRIHFGSLSKCS